MDVLDLAKVLGGAGAGLAVAWKWIGALREDVKFHRGETRRWEDKYDAVINEQRKLLDDLAEGLHGSGEEA